MSIVPLGGLGTLAALRSTERDFTGTIKLAVRAGLIHPGGLTTLCRVSPPGKEGECKARGAIILRAAERYGGAQVFKLAMQARNLGQLTFSAMNGEGLAAESLPPQVKATSVDAAALEFPHLQNTVAGADAMTKRQGLAHALALPLQSRGSMSSLYTAIAARVSEGAARPFIHDLINDHRISSY